MLCFLISIFFFLFSCFSSPIEFFFPPIFLIFFMCYSSNLSDLIHVWWVVSLYLLLMMLLWAYAWEPCSMWVKWNHHPVLHVVKTWGFAISLGGFIPILPTDQNSSQRWDSWRSPWAPGDVWLVPLALMAQSFEGPGLCGGLTPPFLSLLWPLAGVYSPFWVLFLSLSCAHFQLCSLCICSSWEISVSFCEFSCVLEFVFVSVGVCISGCALQEVFLISWLYCYWLPQISFP